MVGCARGEPFPTCRKGDGGLWEGGEPFPPALWRRHESPLDRRGRRHPVVGRLELVVCVSSLTVLPLHRLPEGTPGMPVYASLLT